jgi:hypothetical protein
LLHPEVGAPDRRRHLLNAIRVEVLQLKAVLVEDLQMNRLAETEKPRS